MRWREARRSEMRWRGARGDAVGVYGFEKGMERDRRETRSIFFNFSAEGGLTKR